MNILELEEKLQNLTQNTNKDDFIFDFLQSYDMPKANIAKLRKNSDINTLEFNGELIVKNKKKVMMMDILQMVLLNLEDMMVGL